MVQCFMPDAGVASVAGVPVAQACGDLLGLLSGVSELIERYVTDTTGAHLSAAAQLGVASHTPEQATPAQIAAFNRGHWAIESLHWIRDTCYREDHCRVRTRSGPRVLASLRNLAVNALRLAGRSDITEATRWASRNMTRPFTI